LSTAAEFVCLGDVPAGIPRQELPSLPVDPVTYAVVSGALFSVCREMDITLQNASLSPIINIGKDFSCALFTADGQLVTQTVNCPGHIGSLHFAVFELLWRFGLAGIRPGDVFVLNDPARGGTHLPDLTLVSPVFAGGELVMFTGMRAHHSDVGGSVAGSLPQSTEIYEEGIRLPPVRLDDGVVDILLANTRTPAEVEGDLDAQLAANAAGVAGVERLFETHGRETVLAVVREQLDHSERSLRASLELPDGVYEAEDWLDGDGQGGGRQLIRASVRVAAGNIYVDFSGTSPQRRAPVNSYLGTTVSMVVTALLALTDPTIMPNHGFYRPIHLLAPSGSILNPLPPAPAAGFPDVCNRVVDVILLALTPANPARAIASTSGTTCNVIFSGVDPRTGEPYVWYSINHQGGWGGREGADGWHDVCFMGANGWDIPVETIEYRYPWRVLAYRLRSGSAGAGRWRGGEGSYVALTPLGHDATLSIKGDRAATPPHGVFGGRPGSTARCTIHRADGQVEPVAPDTLKAERIPVRLGDVVVIEGTSGGGYGDPHDRPAAEVARDVRDGLVEPEAARRDYGWVPA
jgi:N-methylhydantoinase B